MQDAPELAVHKEWLGQIQQIGLVVSPHVLAKHNVGINRQQSLATQTKLLEITSGAEEPRVNTFLEFVTEVLEWPADLLAGAPGGPDLPESLTVALPEYDDRLSPNYAIPDLALISVVGTDANLDKPNADQKGGWRASPHARLERLLRETNVPIGLLFNHTHLRLVYAPRGESSGHLTFRFKHLLETLGRPMAGALYALLGVERVTDVLPDAQRLPALLKESRKYQNVVSTKLAGQVLEALWQLLRGFQRANDETKGALLAEALRENPQEVYGGLLSTLMRLVFVLYAEDRGLMPASDVYQKHYAVSGLFERLREDAARYPDTMDARFGAWAQFLALFRLIHDGGGRDAFRFPPRHGRLFNPDAYPFLEGRPLGSARVMGAPIDPPRVPDGVVFRVLQNLLLLDGERLSYRALDVEQIGSVYEAMMGFALQQATGPSIAVRPKNIVINLGELLEQRPKERAAWLQKQAELKVTGEALAKATTIEETLAALGKKVSREYTPAPLGLAVMYLQPTEERRRSGSHYTPRSLTAPIVQTTFRPIFERLGDQATPEQILDLKVCDPAMGSGAFLVEACRLLAERLVRAWEVHKSAPRVPDDEDVLTYAKRLVAERCLYGVDKNVFAVDLAKLSLWLTTLAREHPFTFLDHALRHGDSLVGLTREQIACFNWETDKQLPLLRGLIDERVKEAQGLREQIQGMATSDDVPAKARLLKEANEALHDVRRIGDLVVSAFFEREKPKDRHVLRIKYAGDVQAWIGSRAVVVSGFSRTGADAVAPTTFHWEIEFPEVFTRANPGFDAFVGNPPFAGKNTISASHAPAYLAWLLELHEESHGNADLVAHFYRRAFNLLRAGGAFGLIATNTIAQGDTRGTGLRWIRHHGGTIFAARKRIKWPGEAAVVVSVVHVHKGELVGPFDLNGRAV
ncbi:MAG: N-6 DNA methylase, partial [Acidobacteria bacterium]|nr:N-6 DNA methylase [Acidobacteriota bacterium]